MAGGGALAAVAYRRRTRERRVGAGDGRLIARSVLGEPWKGNWDVLARHVAATYVGQDLADGHSLVGPEALRSHFERYRIAFPDGRITVDDQVAEGAFVTTRWTLRGTHTGELDGFAPTGKQITVSGITLSRLQADLVVEEWWSWDRLGLLVQLGAISEPARA